jgi:hypothetical protein
MLLLRRQFHLRHRQSLNRCSSSEVAR